MDEEKNKKTLEYIESLPKPVQDFVFDGVWQERVGEIVKKYSLSENQADSLINSVLLVLIGLENPDTFLDTIVTDLGISKLLAEQVTSDLDVRVFDYAVKTVEDKGGEPKLVSTELIVDTNEDIPEIRPEMTPMVEPDEKVHINPVPQPLSLQQQTQSILSQNQPVTPQEPIQRPTSVPRYTAVPMEEEEIKPAVKINPIEPAKILEPIQTPPKKYTADPYREPLE